MTGDDVLTLTDIVSGIDLDSGSGTLQIASLAISNVETINNSTGAVPLTFAMTCVSLTSRCRRHAAGRSV